MGRFPISITYLYSGADAGRRKPNQLDPKEEQKNHFEPARAHKPWEKRMPYLWIYKLDLRYEEENGHETVNIRYFFLRLLLFRVQISNLVPSSSLFFLSGGEKQFS